MEEGENKPERERERGKVVQKKEENGCYGCRATTGEGKRGNGTDSSLSLSLSPSSSLVAWHCTRGDGCRFMYWFHGSLAPLVRSNPSLPATVRSNGIKNKSIKLKIRSRRLVRAIKFSDMSIGETTSWIAGGTFPQRREKRNEKEKKKKKKKKGRERERERENDSILFPDVTRPSSLLERSFVRVCLSKGQPARHEGNPEGHFAKIDGIFLAAGKRTIIP